MARGGMSDDPDKRARQLENLRRGETRAPLGNTRALKSGAFSEVAIAPFAAIWEQRFAEKLAADSPLRNDPRFFAYIAVVSKVFARLEQVGQWLDVRMGDLSDPNVQRNLDIESRLRRESGDALQALRMAPADLGTELKLQAYLDELEERVLAAERIAAGDIVNAEQVS